jgi:tetratricopeptide (TPR) repeat protein
VSRELARLYIEKGDPRRALPKLQVCFKADPRDIEVLSLLASAFEALDQRAKAVSVLKELARILAENGDNAARIDVYRRIADLEPNDAEAEAVLSGVRRAQSSPVIAPVVQQQPVAPPPVKPLSQTGGWIAQRQTDEMPPSAVHEFDDPERIRGTGAAPILDDDELLNPAPQPVTQTSVGQLLDAGDSRGRNSEEDIQRILNETDVYIKYKLYSKAIEHVGRVFELDGRHVEAREKLKALYLTIGKKEEAVLELWALAEQAEPGRQRRYLREILELDPNDGRAAGLLGEAAPSEEEMDARPATQELDDDQIEELADDEFAEAEPSGLRPGLPADDDLIPVVVEPMGGSPSPAIEEDDEDRFGLPEPVEDRFGFGDADKGVVAVPASDSEVNAVEEGIEKVAKAPPMSPPIMPKKPVRYEAEASGHDLHTRFDDQAARFIEQFANEEIDESELPPVNLPPTRGTATQKAPAHLLEEPVRQNAAPADRPESPMEDDLDEADFFIQQSLFEEARSILESLLSRYPSHPLVMAKLRDLEAMEGSGAAPPAAAAVEEVVEEEEEVVVPPPMEPLPAAVSAELPSDLPGHTDAGIAAEEVAEPLEMTRRGVIEKGVTAEDFETHYDLGIAYKEMGLLDDAIGEFKLCMKDPSREVQCHLMIGLCCLEKGQVTEAIGHFKKGLYVEGITERESLSLYFELGQAYERLNDPREALYYYEKVVKRDARFRNVEQRIEALRGGAEERPEAPRANPDDVDAAFDSLLGDER